MSKFQDIHPNAKIGRNAQIGSFVTIEEDVVINIPNIFSPNGDDFNDWFYPIASTVVEIEAFYVFDRWGNVVFTNTNFPSNSPQEGWDGKMDGRSPVLGVYTYLVIIKANQGLDTSVFGDITLVR